MAESRQIPDEGASDGNRLNRGNFLRRAELLRRIHWKTWMLLVSLAAYGVLLFAAVQFGEIGKEFFPLLLFVPGPIGPDLFQELHKLLLTIS